MESSHDYFDNTRLIIFYEGENPNEMIPEGWVILERTEPSTYKGFVNPGTVLCRPPREVVNNTLT